MWSDSVARRQKHTRSGTEVDEGSLWKSTPTAATSPYNAQGSAPHRQKYTYEVRSINVNGESAIGRLMASAETQDAGRRPVPARAR